MSPIRTFIRRPVFTSMLLLAVVVFGLFAYPRIGVDQMPDVDFPIVTVTTILPGADPETVEENVSKPLEEALNTLSGLETLRSSNFESVSQVVLRFDLERRRRRRRAGRARQGPGDALRSCRRRSRRPSCRSSTSARCRSCSSPSPARCPSRSSPASPRTR